MSKYEVRLKQQEWITTEVFEFEAEDQEDAIAQAEEMIEATKDLEVEYDLEAVKMPDPEPVELPQTEDEETNNEEVDDGGIPANDNRESGDSPSNAS